MRLAIFPQMPIAYSEGQWFCSEATYGSYIEGIAEHFDKVIVCARQLDPIVNERRFDMTINAGYRFESAKLEIIPLPDHIITERGIWQTYLKHWRTLKTLWQSRTMWDAQYIWFPSATSIMAWLVALVARKPFFIYISGHWEGVWSTLRRWNGWRDRLFKLSANLIAKIQQVPISQSSFRLWEGDVLYPKLASAHKQDIVLSTAVMPDSWFTWRNDTCKGDNIRLISIGKLIIRKGNNYLLEAASILRERGHNVEVWLVGDGEERENLEMQAETLGLSENVTFWGQVKRDPGVIELCREADVFVLPALSEGFPRAITEAASQSLPIITTGVGAIPQRIQNGVQALIVPPEDTSALVDALELVIQNDEQRRALIRTAHSWAKELEGIDNDAVELTINAIKAHYPKWSLSGEHLAS